MCVCVTYVLDDLDINIFGLDDWVGRWLVEAKRVVMLV